MADKKILLFAVLLLAACTADPAMDGADGGNSSANTAAAAKLINTPYDAKQGSLIVCFDDAAVPTIEATAASFAATRGDAGDAAVLTRSGIAPVDEVLQGLEITSLRRVFPYTPRHEERTRAAGLHKVVCRDFRRAGRPRSRRPETGRRGRSPECRSSTRSFM